MAAAKQPHAHDRSRKALLLCIVLLLCGIGAEAYLLIRRAENSIHIVQRDPAAELLDAFFSGDYKAASRIRLTDYPDADVPEIVTQKLKAQAEAIHKAYFAGQTDASAAKAQTEAIIQLDIPELTKAVQPILEGIRLREAALLMIKQADAYLAAGDYAAAYAQYRKIPQNDAEIMQLIDHNFTQSSTMLAAQTVADANAAARNNDYDTAISLLEDTLRIYDNKNDELKTTLKTIKTHQQQDQYLQICKEARICFDAEAYADAFDTLFSTNAADLEDSVYAAMLADTLKSYQDAYFRILPLQMYTLLESGEQTQAESLVNEAAELFPDAPETAALKEQYQQALPKELISVSEPILNDFIQTDTVLTGFDGSTYQSESGNLYCSYDGTLSGRQSCSAVFRIDGGYRRLTLTALPLESFDADLTVLLEISADSKILETYAVSHKFGVLDIVLDITGAEEIRLRVKPTGDDEDLRHAGVILADAKITA